MFLSKKKRQAEAHLFTMHVLSCPAKPYPVTPRLTLPHQTESTSRFIRQTSLYLDSITSFLFLILILAGFVCIRLQFFVSSPTRMNGSLNVIREITFVNIFLDRISFLLA